MTNPLPRILFVDDDPGIITALQSLVEDEAWDCSFAQSVNQALGIMQEHRFDLVLSDVDMPGRNGFALLNEVKNLYPWTVRIFLTSQARQEAVIQALTDGCAQQIIPKPWFDQELKEIIRSALRQSLQQRKHSPEFQQLINSIPLLPVLPERYSNIRSCIVEGAAIDRLANIISQDVGISSNLMRWANSALFGQRFQVDTLKKAIVILGTDVVESLILSEAISRTIIEHAPKAEDFNPQEFQKHSNATAIVARLLIKTVFSQETEKQDRAFIAGLLHDIGKLAAACYFSQKFSAAVKQAEREQASLASAEMKVFGTTHAELGGFLAEWWALPPFIVNAVQWHHAPNSSPIERDVIDAVHVANLLSYQFESGEVCGTRPAEAFKQSWDKFYLSDEGVEILRVETGQLLQAMSS